MTATAAGHPLASKGKKGRKDGKVKGLILLFGEGGLIALEVGLAVQTDAIRGLCRRTDGHEVAEDEH